MECKFIPGYEGLYMIYKDGRVLSCKLGKTRTFKFLSISNKTGWYVRVNLRKNKRSKTFYVHRLVADAFLENTNNHCEVNHIDGNKQNNHVDNLEWCTHSMNIQHAFDTGLKDRSLITGMKPKLTHSQAVAIHDEYKSSEITYIELGVKYNVSRETIRRTIKRVTA